MNYEESKMPSISPFGAKELAADKRKRDGVSCLAIGDHITLQRTSSATTSSLTIDFCGGHAEEEVINSMVKRASSCFCRNRCSAGGHKH